MGQQEEGQKVRVVCSRDCGRVYVLASLLTLYICPDDPGRNCYAFACSNPECGALTVRPADETIISVLHGVGCPIVSLAIPEEWREHEAGAFDGKPALTDDDLIDFMAGVDRFNRTGAWSG